MQQNQPSTNATTTQLAVSSKAASLPARLHASGPLLRDLDDHGIRLLAVRLLAISKLLGLHNIPDEAQLLQLSEFTRRNFPDVTEAEIVHAVDQWAAGNLCPELKTFGTISIDFLGTILNTWKAERAAHLREERQRMERIAREAEPESTPPADDFHDRLVRSYAAEHGTLPPIADWQACWRHLRVTGELPTLTHEQVTTYEDEQRRILQDKRYQDRLTGRRVYDLDPDGDRDVWHAHLRECRAREYYNQLIKTSKL